MIRRSGLILALAALGACAKPPPSPPQPAPASDSVPPPVPRPVPAPAPAPVEPPPPRRMLAPVTLAFVGDINLGTLTVSGGVPPDHGRGLLDAAREALAGDLVVGNFEGVLGDSGTTYKCGRAGRHVTLADTAQPKPVPVVRPPRTVEPPRTCYAFLTPTALAPRLAEGGFTHLNLANNHASDFGLDARVATEQILDSLGLGTYGPIGSIAVDTVRRGDSLTTVGLLGFTTYPYAYDLLDIARSAAVVDSVGKLVDLLVVTFHGGAEGVKALHVAETAESLGREPRGDLRAWARAVIDAGADLIVGHGPHVLRGIEFYQGKPIVYSLGNFLTYRGFNLEGPLGLTGVLQLEAGPDLTWRRGRFVPMVQLPGKGPAPDPDGAALHLIRTLSSEDFGGTAARLGDGGEILAPE